jgi:hypothetical protein
MPKVSIMTDDKYPISESNDIGGIGDGLGGIGDGLICAILLRDVKKSRRSGCPSSRRSSRRSSHRPLFSSAFVPLFSSRPSVRSNLCGLWCGDRSAPPPPREQIADGPAGSDKQSEQQRRHMRYLFGPGCISGVHEQSHRTDANHPHDGHAAGNTEGPHHLRLLDA